MTAATASATSTAPAASARFGAGRTIRLGLARAGYEVRSYFRQGDTVFFTFLFPLLMLTIFSVAFSAIDLGRLPDGEKLTAAQYYLPAMLAAGALLSGLQNMATDIAMEKSDGTLKRLGGTPLSPLSYFIGKVLSVLATSAIQLALLILFARLAFDVALPAEPSAWLTLLWVYLLGVAMSCVVGIALSALPRSGRSATAVVVPIVLVLQFISGVYLPFTMLPEWMQAISAAFPLKWLAQGMRAVFLPDDFRVLEAGESWNLPLVALMLTLWIVAGLVIARLTFRWIRKDG